jgi:hypothetical protein
MSQKQYFKDTNVRDTCSALSIAEVESFVEGQVIDGMLTVKGQRIDVDFVEIEKKKRIEN